ncbi:hypothetical protein F7725_015235 [Dissostichus mawsoni]|uniref:ST8 alpha-N-acetyl-neuraminide alpha-2,8-sialyltransferase 3 n=1 Tax=Dissostichus mawsoni TaxID=36200 RepID=A0A7J5YKA8_DISMA|nr:hypothetical protein F7725_015235 [Dissostichus mawsoni]
MAEQQTKADGRHHIQLPAGVEEYGSRFQSSDQRLSEDLQNSSRWTYNSSAFLQLKIGQLMHYDYSSHKYVFSIGENFRSLLPEVSPILNKQYNVCAVVGNSGILTGSRCGPQIDKFDFVFRCNFAPTEMFKKDVGRRTNMTTFNPSILEKYYNNLLTVQDRNNFFLSLKKLDGAILWIPAFFFHTSATVTRTLVDFFVEHRGQLNVKLAWPGNIMQYVNSTGILMYTLASSMCNQIHLYGFWPFGWDPNTGKELPYHYYDRKGTKFTTKWQESHQLPAEFKLLYKMHMDGLLKLSLSHCAAYSVRPRSRSAAVVLIVGSTEGINKSNVMIKEQQASGHS